MAKPSSFAATWDKLFQELVVLSRQFPLAARLSHRYLIEQLGAVINLPPDQLEYLFIDQRSIQVRHYRPLFEGQKQLIAAKVAQGKAALTTLLVGLPRKKRAAVAEALPAFFNALGLKMEAYLADRPAAACGVTVRVGKAPWAQPANDPVVPDGTVLHLGQLRKLLGLSPRQVDRMRELILSDATYYDDELTIKQGGWVYILEP